MPVIRETRQMFSKPIGVRSFDTGEQRIGNAIANFANKAGNEFYERAAVNAEKFGLEAGQSVSSDDLTSFDPKTGKLEVMSSTDGMGSIASSAFERVIERRFVDTVDKDIRLKSSELANKYDDPVQYENMFTSYLDSISKSADDRHQNVIQESGKYLMASTKITLANNARRKARAAAAQDVSNTNTEYAEIIFDTAASGQTTTTIPLIEERYTATLEAEAAGLLKNGSADAVRSSLAVQGLSGALQVVMADSTPVQQASINLYIATQGRSGGDAITFSQKSILDQFVGYIDRGNTRAILAESNLSASNVNAVRSAEIAEQTAIFKQDSAKFKLNYPFDSVFPTRANSLRHSQQAWSSGDQGFVAASVSSAGFDHRGELIKLNSKRASNQITQEEYNGFTQDIRRASLDSIVLGMASDGNIDALKAAFVTQAPLDIAKLTPLQQVAFQSLQQTMLYDPADDRSYVQTLIGGTQNEVQNKIETEMRNANLFIDIDNVSADFLNGSYNPEAIQKAEKRAANALSTGDITASEFDSLSQSLRVSAGKGIANIGSSSMTAFEMTALANYIASGGEEGAGVNQYVTSVGEAILRVVPADGRAAVANHANSVREKLEKKESIANAKLQKQQLRADVIGGKGKASNKLHRQTSQEILEEAGVNITQPESKADSVYALMRTSPPQNLIDGLNNIALGLEVDGAGVLLDHFAVLSNDATTDGLFINRFGTGEGAALSATKVAFLQDVVNIRKQTGQPASVIAATLVSRRDDPKSRIYAQTVFTKRGSIISPKEYVSNQYGDLIGEDLGDTAEYYALIGLDSKEIDAKIEAIVDNRFVKSDVVVDPRFPMGVNNRTQHSLQTNFPNEDRRDEFTRIINSELPSGFELARKESNRARTKRAVKAGMEVPKYVYLVPSENTAGASYYAYFTDENNELRPLITEIDGQLTWPLFEEDILSEFDSLRAIEEANKVEAQLDQKQKTLDALSLRPGIRTLDDLSNIKLR